MSRRRPRVGSVMMVLGAVLVLVSSLGFALGTDQHGPSAAPPAPSTTTEPAVPSPPPAAGSTTSTTTAESPVATSDPIQPVAAAPFSAIRVEHAAGGQILSTADLSPDIGVYDPVPRPGGFERITPEGYAQAVWVQYQPLVTPSSAAPGSTFIYGHACRFHECPFTQLYQTQVGDLIIGTTAFGTLTYQVDVVRADYSKDGEWDSNEPNGIRLIACQYDAEGVSSYNVYVSGHLVAATPPAA